MSIKDWAESRLGLGAWVNGWLSAPVTGAPSWARASVVALLVSLGMTALSGVGLAITYAPSGASAWASVYFTEFQLSGGWFVRSLHLVGTELSIVFGALSLLLSVIEGRYRGRRELPFWCLSIIAAIPLLFAISGNPLRWDNRGFFGFQTEANIAAELPLIGAQVRSLLVGGPTLNNWTLARLYAAHVLLLPLACALIFAIWRRSSRRAAALTERTATYGDTQLPRDLALGALVALLIAVGAYFRRAPLEAPADPIASYNARPEWYFQALYVLRNAVPASTQGLVASLLPLLAGAALFALPLLDRDEQATPRRRAPFIGAVALGLIAIAGGTLVGLRHDASDPELRSARASQAKLDKRALQIAQTAGISPAGALASMREDPVLRAEDLFRDKCASCHKLGELGPADGKTSAPALDGWGTEKWVLALLDDPDSPQMFGGSAYEGKMPSYTRAPKDPQAAADFKPMPKEQLDAIARYLAGEARGAAAGHEPEGERLVRQRCTSCHLLHGEGDDPSGLAPELEGWASLTWTRAQIANPGTDETYRAAALSPALEGHMPRFDNELSAADLDLLTRFALHRARPESP